MSDVAQGDVVYLGVDSGLMCDPPLFGVVDFTDGTANSGKDVVRVCWENGTFAYFSTKDRSINKLIVVDPDPDALTHEGVPCTFTGSGPAWNGVVSRTWLEDGTLMALVAAAFQRLEYPFRVRREGDFNRQDSWYVTAHANLEVFTPTP